MKIKTAIAIITKSRNLELTRCLKSIFQQTILPTTIIVVDNDLRGSAKQIVNKFSTINQSKFKKCQIEYYQKQGSVPKCRNFAMQIARSNYLGFIDDDCVLDKNWLKKALKKINSGSDKKINYVLGETKLFNTENIIALAQHARDAYWKKQQYKIFDTKNVLLNLKVISNAKLKFDEKCQSSFYDSADFDFDFQLKKNKINGSFCKEMITHHQETSNYQRFINRAWHRGKLANYLTKKWKIKERLINQKDSIFLIWFLRSLKNFSKEYCRYQEEMGNQSLIKKIIATWLIKIFERYYALGYDSTN